MPIPGTVPVSAPIAPTDASDTFGTHADTYGIGGYRTVADITARDAITTERRKVGMVVGVVSNGLAYRLGPTTSNSDWTQWPSPQGVGTVTQVSVATANGVSAVVNTPTTTPNLTIYLGNIVPSTVNGLVISTTTGTLAVANGATLTVPSMASVSGTNTGDITLPGDSTKFYNGTGVFTVPPGSGGSFYSTDGSLTGDRTVSGANHIFTIQDWSQFVLNSDSPGTAAYAGYLTITGDGTNFRQTALQVTSLTGDLAGMSALVDTSGGSLTLSGSFELLLQTPAIIAGTAVNGQVPTLTDSVTGKLEYATPTVATTLYTSDGTLSGDRQVNANSNSLTFTNFSTCVITSDISSSNDYRTSYSQVANNDILSGAFTSIVNNEAVGPGSNHSTIFQNCTAAASVMTLGVVFSSDSATIALNSSAGVLDLTASGQIKLNSQTSVVAGTTAKAPFNFISGVAPTSPSNGDFWFDGTNFKCRVGGVTKTFTIT